jgi:hypothetical protein
MLAGAAAAEPGWARPILPFEENGVWRATLQLRVDPGSWNVTAEFGVQSYSDVVAGDVLKLKFHGC